MFGYLSSYLQAIGQDMLEVEACRPGFWHQV
jgi:hypothetical protein